MINIEKIPPLKCDKCGGINVVMTDDGPECDNCDKKTLLFEEITNEVEYRLYETNKTRRIIQ